MYCVNCGKQINRNDKYCSNCGTENQYYISDGNGSENLNGYTGNTNYLNGSGVSGTNYNNPNPVNFQYSYRQSRSESQTLGIAAIIFSILGGLLGPVLAIVGLLNYKEQPGRKKCKIALGIFVMWIIVFILGYIYS